MDLIKKHYDKIILGAVALVVIGFLVFLPFVIKSDQDQLSSMADAVTSPKVQPLPPLDLGPQSNIVQRVGSPAQFDFSSTNRIFNPVEWRRASDGTLMKIETWNKRGAEAAVVTAITPLNFVLSFDSVVTNSLSPRYVVGVENQAATVPAQRRKQQRFVSTDDPKKDFFTLTNVVPPGATNDPEGLVLKLADTGETVVITRDRPYERPDAYAADLRSDPDKKNFKGLRVGSAVSFGGGDYIVVAIDLHEVVLFDQSNQKKTTLQYTP